MSKILIVGDSCTDIFIYGSIHRISPEAPVPVFNPTHQTENGGMSKNVESNLKALGCDVVHLVTNENRIIKKRYVDYGSNQMVLRVDEYDKCDRIDQNELTSFDGYDAIIISDYCKGFLTKEDIKYICDNYKNVFIDTKKQLGNWIVGADYIKINSLEHQKNFEIIPNYPELDDKLIITKGKEGCVYKNKTYSVKEVSVKDVSGAGDTFLSALVFKYLETNNIIKSIKFAQECTTIVVQKHGVTTI